MPEFILALATPLSYYPYWKGAPLENTIPPVPPNTFVDVVLVFKALTGPKHLWEKLSNRKIQEEPLRWAACYLFAVFRRNLQDVRLDSYVLRERTVPAKSAPAYDECEPELTTLSP